MITPITATFPALNFPKEVDYPTQEDWAAFSAAAELNYGILSGTWSDKSEEFKAQTNNLALEIQEIGENAFNAISLNTIEDLATYTGTGLVMVKDLNRGGTFIYDATQSAVNNGGTVFDGWVRQYSGAINVKWFDTSTNFNNYVYTQTYINSTGSRLMSNIIIGAKALKTSTSARDAIQVSRDINGNTDCHAFADKTVILNATDSGTYGTFDSQTVIAGTHNQSHQFSFQDRAEFSGSGTLDSWGNIIWPKYSGIGNITARTDIQIKEITGSITGSFDTHIGLDIDALTKATSNIAVRLLQSSGYAMYAPNAGKWLIGGQTSFTSPVAFGATSPISGVPLSWTSVVGATRGFASSSASGVQWGVSGDSNHTFVSNAAERIIIENSVGNYALRPAASTQNLGTSTKQWNIGYLKQVKFTPISTTEAENLALFIDNVDGALKYKSSAGVVRTLSFT